MYIFWTNLLKDLHMRDKKTQYLKTKAESIMLSQTIGLNLHHNWAKSIDGSPHGDPWLESCKNPAVIRRMSTHPALIRRWPDKFNSQLKFAPRPLDASPLFLIRRRPVGHRPIPERRSVGHRPKCSGKNPQAIERRSGNLRSMTARWSPCHRTEIRRCL